MDEQHIRNCLENIRAEMNKLGATADTWETYETLCDKLFNNQKI